ncbi:MAG: lysoplasmalogenase [Kofleriaceae bacterium]
MTAAIVASTMCALAVARLVQAERAGDRPGRLRWKPLASAAFVAVPLVGGADLAAGATLAIVVGLALGAVGDLALMFDDERAFLGGLVAFLGGHVAYVVALAQVVPSASWWTPAVGAVAVGAAGISLGVLRWLWPRLGAMRAPVCAYVAVITAMLVGGVAATLVGDPHAAPAGARALLTAGATLFFASDLAVAREKFMVRDVRNRTIGLPVYYLAQLAFGWAVLIPQLG